MSWFDTMVIPIDAPNGVAARQVHELRLRPGQRGPDRRLRAVHLAGARACRTSWSKLGGDAAALAESPLLFPGDAEKANMYVFGDMSEELDTAVDRPLPHHHRRLRTRGGRMATDADDRTLRKAKWTPYLLAAPGPALHLPLLPRPARHAAQDRRSRSGRSAGAARSTSRGSGATSRRPSPTSATSSWRALVYAGITTVVCILLAYPLAYFIAFKAGRWRNLLLGLVMVPFFTSFLLRTIAWQSLFADNGPVLGDRRDAAPHRRARLPATSPPTARSSTPRRR